MAEETLNTYLETHLLDVTCLRTNNFDEFILKRASKLLDVIGAAMGKSLTVRDSQEIVDSFGGTL